MEAGKIADPRQREEARQSAYKGAVQAPLSTMEVASTAWEALKVCTAGPPHTPSHHGYPLASL